MTTAPKSVLGTLSTLANRTIRGIRDSVPQGYFLGRVSKGDGPVELVSMGSLLASLKAAGVGGAVGANPTATAKDTAVNGTAATFMRSDGAPAVQKGDSTNFGIVKVDGTTIVSATGVIRIANSTPGFSQTIFLMSGTFTTDAASTTETVYRYRLLAGGGGGAGGATTDVASGAAGGGSGEYAEGTFTGVAPSTAISIAIGTGGAGGAVGDNAGSDGVDSSIGTPVSITAHKGGGASPNSSTSLGAPGAGGTGSTAPVVVPGQAGQGTTVASGMSGQGGSTPLGSGGALRGGLAGNGFDGTGFGSGGGGARIVSPVPTNLRCTRSRTPELQS